MVWTRTSSGFRPAHLRSNPVIASTRAPGGAPSGGCHDQSAHLHVPGVRPTTKAGAAPHLYTLIEGDAVTGLRSAGLPGKNLPEEAAQMQPGVVADRSAPPDPVSVAQD